MLNSVQLKTIAKRIAPNVLAQGLAVLDTPEFLRWELEETMKAACLNRYKRRLAEKHRKRVILALVRARAGKLADNVIEEVEREYI